MEKIEEGGRKEMSDRLNEREGLLDLASAKTRRSNLFL